MALNNDEKAIVEEALQVYVQVLARQAPPQQVQQIAQIIKGIILKLDSVGGGSGKQGAKSPGITDEWFNKVCKTCDKLGPDGCTDKVTEKYPGKCDPIIHFENKKRGLEKK
jgi:hypothetical protein